MVTPQEIKMVCGESNAINGKKLTTVKKLFAFDKV